MNKSQLVPCSTSLIQDRSAFEVEVEDTEYPSEDFSILSGDTKFTIPKLER